MITVQLSDIYHTSLKVFDSFFYLSVMLACEITGTHIDTFKMDDPGLRIELDIIVAGQFVHCGMLSIYE